MTASFAVEILAGDHDRTAFSCGVEALDRYLKTQVSQDVRRRFANCFVAVPTGQRNVAGYYTLSAAEIDPGQLPAEMARRLPRYPRIPAALIGRLAVDRQYRGTRLGKALLFDAIERASRSATAVFAVVVDAESDEAAAFYKHHDFLQIAEQPRRFFLPIATFNKPSNG